MTITIQGVIVDIFPVETYGNLNKRVVHLQEIDVQYPNFWSVEFLQTNVNVPDNYVPGDIVKVQADLRGRKWAKNGKEGVITSINGWRMERVGASTKPVPSNRQRTGGGDKPAQDNTAQQGYQAVDTGDAGDDLPF